MDAKIDIIIRGTVNSGKSTVAEEVYRHLMQQFGIMNVELFDMDAHDQGWRQNQSRRIDTLCHQRGIKIRVAVEQHRKE